MDTSKEYIKMCEKAEEIQKGHDFENSNGIIGIYYYGNDVYWGIRIAYNALKNICPPSRPGIYREILLYGTTLARIRDGKKP